MVCLRQPKYELPRQEERKSPIPPYSPSPTLDSPNSASYSPSPLDVASPVPVPLAEVFSPPSSIVVSVPRPTITCNGCGTGNTLLLSFLKCACCAGSDFTWTCSCSAFAQSPLIPPPTIPVTLHTPPPIRKPPVRSLSAKSWSQRIKYMGPITRRTTYHSIDCLQLSGAGVNISTIEFANAYKMKPAPCCHEQ